MERTIEAGRTGVVINDMINGNYRRKTDVQHNQAIEASGIIASTLRLVEGVRQHGMTTFWIRVDRRPDRADIVDNAVDQPTAWHSSNPPTTAESYEGSFLDEVTLATQDQIVVKPRIDPFIGTDLDLQLKARRLDTILLCGYSTNAGVESCARTAHDLGYNVVVVKDCVYNIPEELHRFAIERILPRFARVMSSEEALAALR